LRIAILNVGAPPNDLAQRHGGYDAMVQSLLGQHDYVVFREGALPDPSDRFDAVVITGSPAGVNDSHGWIAELVDFIRQIAGKTKLVGLCFGHQLIAHAFGGTVVKAPQGWGLGVHRFALHAGPEWVSRGGEIALAVAHQDQVIEIPDGAKIVASNAFTPFAALHYPALQAITFQSHPEFTDAFAYDLFGALDAPDIDEALRTEAFAALNDIPTDGPEVGAWINRFLGEDSSGVSAANRPSLADQVSALDATQPVRFVLLSFTDLLGCPRAKLVPATALANARDGTTRFAGAGAWFDLAPSDSDLCMVPDAASLVRLPWCPDVAWVTCSVEEGGYPFAQSPRDILQAQVAKAAARGLTFKMGIECEFFLLPQDMENASLRSGRLKPSYDQNALMGRFDVIAELCDGLEALGWGPYQADHEGAWDQFEINWAYSDALKSADQAVFFKYMAKSIAERHGLRASFMPKPFADAPGNGMHVHVSAWRDGQNMCLDEAEPLGLSALGRQMIDGLLHSADALTAICNPVVNSYKRLNPAQAREHITWAPSVIGWGGDDRKKLIRVPEPGRFEFRLPDGAANPYLLLAAIIATSLDGIDQARPPAPLLSCDITDGFTGSPYNTLPRNLLDAIRNLENSSTLVDALGPLVPAYARLKHAEWDRYASHISVLERAAIFDY